MWGRHSVFSGRLALMVLPKGMLVRTKTFGVDKVTTLSGWLIRQLKGVSK